MLLLSALILTAPVTPVNFEIPGRDQYAQVVPGGVTVLPNGRWLRPKGMRLYTGEDLWQVVRNPRNDTMIGIHDGGFTVYPASGDKTKKQVFARKQIAPAAVFDSSGERMFLSLGDSGEIEIVNTSDYSSSKIIKINDGGKFNAS